MTPPTLSARQWQDLFVAETPLRQGNAHGFAPRRRPRSVYPLVDPNLPLAPREALLAAAARAVLAAFRDPLEQRELGGPATAALRLLESALEPYFGPPK